MLAIPKKPQFLMRDPQHLTETRDQHVERYHAHRAEVAKWQRTVVEIIEKDRRKNKKTRPRPMAPEKSS